MLSSNLLYVPDFLTFYIFHNATIRMVKSRVYSTITYAWHSSWTTVFFSTCPSALKLQQAEAKTCHTKDDVNQLKTGIMSYYG